MVPKIPTSIRLLYTTTKIKNRGIYIYYKQDSNPIGYVYKDKETDLWGTFYRHSDIGHLGMDSEQEALDVVIDVHQEYLALSKRRNK